MDSYLVTKEDYQNAPVGTCLGLPYPSDCYWRKLLDGWCLIRYDTHQPSCSTSRSEFVGAKRKIIPDPRWQPGEVLRTQEDYRDAPVGTRIEPYNGVSGSHWEKIENQKWIFTTSITQCPYTIFFNHTGEWDVRRIIAQPTAPSVDFLTVDFLEAPRKDDTK